MNDETITDKTLLELLATVRIVGHEAAAKSQLEQAIFLWFHKDDPRVFSDETSVHTLAAAVQGILWAYAHDSRQRPSRLRQKIENLPADEYATIVDSQNFFKHGGTGRKEEKGKRKAVSHLPDLTELFLADNICTFNRLFKISSAFMDMFLLRYSLSFPKSGIRLKTLEIKLVGSGYDLEAVAALDRKAFDEFVNPYALANLLESYRAVQG